MVIHVKRSSFKFFKNIPRSSYLIQMGSNQTHLHYQISVQKYWSKSQRHHLQNWTNLTSWSPTQMDLPLEMRKMLLMMHQRQKLIQMRALSCRTNSTIGCYLNLTCQPLGVLLTETIFPIGLKNLNLRDLRDLDGHQIDTLGKVDLLPSLLLRIIQQFYYQKLKNRLSHAWVFHCITNVLNMIGQLFHRIHIHRLVVLVHVIMQSLFTRLLTTQ